ncbi:ATP-binding protein [Streptomyces halobius]|uniref:ATP-binding protein n=1 Tax=Streptomyces halobius TaxID=2879846 RepID=A0ABY4LZ86_9ACTN|nr:ATP-binding protein [Streptomyces halobius]UQA90801.1 ATP-binding protein [Streptomyces halobius]
MQAVLRAARQARTFTEKSLRRWGEGAELIEAAVLIVCELATNAICHGAQETGPGSEPGPEAAFTLRLALQPEVLHIEVRDGSAVLPVQRAAGREDGCGRGLLIISALAESWTCGPDPDGGKWVRASLSRVADALMG